MQIRRKCKSVLLSKTLNVLVFGQKVNGFQFRFLLASAGTVADSGYLRIIILLNKVLYYRYKRLAGKHLEILLNPFLRY